MRAVAVGEDGSREVPWTVIGVLVLWAWAESALMSEEDCVPVAAVTRTIGADMMGMKSAVVYGHRELGKVRLSNSL